MTNAEHAVAAIVNANAITSAIADKLLAPIILKDRMPPDLVTTTDADLDGGIAVLETALQALIILKRLR